MSESGRLDYTRRTFSTLIEDALRYIKHYIPAIQDTTRSNTGIRFLRLLAGVVDVLLRYLDLVFNERSIKNAKQLRSQILNVEVLNYKLSGPTGATGTVIFTKTNAIVGVPSEIERWQSLLTTVGTALNYLTTERTDVSTMNQFDTVEVPVVQGKRFTNEILAQASDGSLDQEYLLLRRRPEKQYVEVNVNGVDWTRVDDLMDYEPNDQVYEVTYDENMFGIVVFGDNENGLAPALGSLIKADYVVTEGEGGTTEPNTIQIAVGLSEFTVNNTVGTTGGSDGDTADSIGKNAPAQFASNWNAVNDEDFEALATKVPNVYSAKATFTQAYFITLRIVPVGGQAPSASLLSAVYNYIEPRMMEGVQLTVAGFDLAYMWVVAKVRLKDRTQSKETADLLLLEAVNEFLDYTNQKVGEAWAPSDFHAILEGLNDGELIDIVEDVIFSRVPSVEASTTSVAPNTGEVEDFVLYSDSPYADWTVYATSGTTFDLFRDGSYDSSGTVGVQHTSAEAGGKISFTVNSTVPLDTGWVWNFSTSKKAAPVKINDDEFPQPFIGAGGIFDITFYYPDEWTFE